MLIFAFRQDRAAARITQGVAFNAYAGDRTYGDGVVGRSPRREQQGKHPDLLARVLDACKERAVRC
jgi:hypothetical protein